MNVTYCVLIGFRVKICQQNGDVPSIDVAVNNKANGMPNWLQQKNKSHQIVGLRLQLIFLMISKTGLAIGQQHVSTTEMQHGIN
jgi:hypothetical protein